MLFFFSQLNKWRETVLGFRSTWGEISNKFNGLLLRQGKGWQIQGLVSKEQNDEPCQARWNLTRINKVNIWVQKMDLSPIVCEKCQTVATYLNKASRPGWEYCFKSFLLILHVYRDSRDQFSFPTRDSALSPQPGMPSCTYKVLLRSEGTYDTAQWASSSWSQLESLSPSTTWLSYGFIFIFFLVMNWIYLKCTILSILTYPRKPSLQSK